MKSQPTLRPLRSGLEGAASTSSPGAVPSLEIDMMGSFPDGSGKILP